MRSLPQLRRSPRRDAPRRPLLPRRGEPPHPVRRVAGHPASRGTRRGSILVLLIGGLLAGCDSIRIGTPADASFVSFTYSGHRAGSFHARGEIPTSTSISIWEYTWAAGESFSEGGRRWVILNANLRAGSGSHLLQFIVPAEQRGTFGLSDLNGDFLVLDHAAGFPGTYYGFVSGRVDVTTSTRRRLAGTFEGLALDGDGNELFITNGRFDVRVE